MGGGRELLVVDVQCGRGRDGEKGGRRGRERRERVGKGEGRYEGNWSQKIPEKHLYPIINLKLIPENPKKFLKILKNPKKS